MSPKYDYSSDMLGDPTLQELGAKRNSLLFTSATVRAMLGPAVAEDLMVELPEHFTRKYDQDDQVWSFSATTFNAGSSFFFFNCFKFFSSTFKFNSKESVVRHILPPYCLNT